MLMLAVHMLLNLAGSFFCSLAEASVLASSEARIRARLEQGLSGSPRLLTLNTNPGRTISVLLLLNNRLHVAGTGGLTFVPADAAPETPTAVPVAVAVQAAIMIVLGEILAKVLGEAHPEAVASALVTLMHWVSTALAPLIWFVDLLVAWARPKSRVSPGHEGEIVELARMGRD